MLSKKTFIAEMTLLKKNYIGWQFDLNDQVQIGLWYSAFANLTDERFADLIDDYMASNDKPPMSIKNLTDVYVDRQVKLARIPPEKALETVRNIVSICGGWEYGRKDIYTKLSGYPKSLVETVKEFEDTLRNMSSNDTYAADRFRRSYEQRLRTSAVNEVNKFLGIQTTETKSLGAAALPYET